MIRLLLLLNALVSVGASAARQPNIVVVIADDMGFSDVSCYGGEISTPNIDALAKGGLRFTNYYVNNMCLVTRASLMTGNYPKTAKPGATLSRQCVTLPELLRKSGYTTLMAGKWHLGNHARAGAGSPNDRGFDHWYGIPGGAASFYDPDLLTRDGRDISHEARNDPGYYFTDALSSEAAGMVSRALDEEPGRPFFLYLAYTAAHWPLHARERDIAKHKGTFAQGWDTLRKARLDKMKQLGVITPDCRISPRHPKIPAWRDEQHKSWQERRMEVYAAQVTVMDEGIGKIMDLLRKRNVFDNTLVLYMHDNGACHVEYGEQRKGPYLPGKTRDGRPMVPGNRPDIMPGPEHTYQSVGYGWANLGNTPFRLFKQHDHEGGDRSPLIAHWPQGIPHKGKLEKAVCHVTDLMPTLLEATGVKYPEKFEGLPILPHVGRSFAAAFAGQAVADRTTIFWKHAKGKAVRNGDWKLVAQSRGGWELYNLARDPTELNNLAGSNPEKVSTLRKKWQAWQDGQ